MWVINATPCAPSMPGSVMKVNPALPPSQGDATFGSGAATEGLAAGGFAAFRVDSIRQLSRLEVCRLRTRADPVCGALLPTAGRGTGQLDRVLEAVRLAPGLKPATVEVHRDP